MYEDVYSMNSDSNVMKFIGNESPFINSPNDYYNNWYKNLLSHTVKDETEIFAIVKKETNEYIGFNGIFIPPNENIYELAFRFKKETWGKGYATESSISILKEWFNYKPTSKVFADYHPDNIGSKKILHKLGFIEIDKKYDSETKEYLSVLELTKNEFEKQLTKKMH
jgi:[ribosomal protein S5]-alanine N-acetyltransferase